jgi:bifunctional ADP-heptose synthase (sugar kinase/adenylyltransferase)
MKDLATTQQQTKYNILLIGDSCVDEYKIGTVDRLSPEAPVAVIKVVNEYQLPGMSANVKQNLVNLGIEPDFITNDQEIKKTRYIDQRSGQHLLRVDDEPKIVPWSGHTPFPLNSYDAIVISDYDKGFLLYEQIEYIIKNNIMIYDNFTNINYEDSSAILLEEIIPTYLLTKKPNKLYFNPVSDSRNRLVDMIINKVIEQYPQLTKKNNYLINI